MIKLELQVPNIQTINDIQEVNSSMTLNDVEKQYLKIILFLIEEIFQLVN